MLTGVLAGHVAERNALLDAINYRKKARPNVQLNLRTTVSRSLPTFDRENLATFAGSNPANAFR